MSCRTKWTGPAETPKENLEALLRASIALSDKRPDWMKDGWTVGVPVVLGANPMGEVPSKRAGVIALPPPPPKRPAVAKGNAIASVLSPSQVNGYLDCSARWHYKYVAGLPCPSTGKQVRGKVVHALVSYFFREKMQGRTPEAEALAESYSEIWDNETPGAEFGANENVPELYNTGAQLAALYIKEAGQHVQPRATELAVEGTIGGVAVRGVVDLLCEDTAGKVVDLKTSSRTPSGVAAGHALQLATYAQLAPNASGLVQIDTLVSTKVPKLHTLEYRVSDADRRLTERLYPSVQESMRRGVYLPNRGSLYCSKTNCAFSEQCCAEFGGIVE
jgi:CRISPR/Cas system-associated exonuclease Cas4 (RecB family)